MTIITVTVTMAFLDSEAPSVNGVEDVFSRAANDGLNAECTSIRVAERTVLDVPDVEFAEEYDEAAMEAWQDRAYDQPEFNRPEGDMGMRIIAMTDNFIGEGEPR